MLLALGDVRAPHFSQQYKIPASSSILHFLEKPLEGHLHYKTKTSRNLLQRFQPHPLLLPLGWKTSNMGIILLFTNYFWFQIKDLIWPKFISSIGIGGKERKEKKCLWHFGPALKLKNFMGRTWKTCSCEAQLAECPVLKWGRLTQAKAARPGQEQL